jgi:membrane protease YdiL (CAAX protease family)
MSQDDRWAWLRGAFQGEQRRATIVLLVSPVLIVTWKYFASPERLLATLSPAWVLWDDPQATAAVHFMVWTLVLLGLVPALVVKLVFREPLADYGVQWGIPVRTFRTMAIAGPLFVLGGYLASRDPAVQIEYPLNPSAGSSPAMFGIHALTYSLFYLGWEFHFRGFIQHGLRRSMGDANAVLVGVLASCLAHLGKPASETYTTIVGSLFWGLLAFRTRSLLSGLVQHFLLGLSLDWFLCYG